MGKCVRIMARQKRLQFVKVTDDIPLEVRRFAEKVNVLLREERHAHKMVVRWRRKLIRSGVPADFARKYPMSTQGHLGRMLQKWTLRERNTREKINACKRRYWRALTGDGTSPRNVETRLQYAPIIPQSRRLPDGVRSDQELVPDVGKAEDRELRGAPASEISRKCEADPNRLKVLQLDAMGDWNMPLEFAVDVERSVADLHLSIRSSKVLQRLGIRTLGDLLRHKPTRILAAKNCGKKSLCEIRSKLLGCLHGPRAAQSTPVESASHDLQWALNPTIKANLDMAVEQLCLSRRAANIVAAAGAKTVGQLANLPKAVVAQAPGCGTRTITEIETKLREYGENSICRGIDIGTNCGTQTFCENLLALLPLREQSVIRRRYGLWDGTFATLEAVGQSFGVTRERIRQIEETARKKLKSRFGRMVKLYLQKKISELNGLIPDIASAEDAVLNKFADDCTLGEARLALHFLGDMQSSPPVRFYERVLIAVKAA